MADVEVTREHRMQAIACWEEWPYGTLTPDHEAWLDGLPTLHDDNPYSHVELIAKAIAEAELRGARKGKRELLYELHDATISFARRNPQEMARRAGLPRLPADYWDSLDCAVNEMWNKYGAKP
jgi:hypothetical protein